MNTKNLLFKRANIKDKKKILSFIGKNFKKNHFFLKNPNFFNWQHVFNNLITFGLAKLKTKIVCLQAFVPQSHYDKNLSSKEIHMTIASASKNAPPASLLRLFKYIKDNTRAKIIITSGFDPKTKEYNKRLGFKTSVMDHFFFLSNKKKYKIIKLKEIIHQSIRVENNNFIELKKKDLKNNKYKSHYKFTTPKKSNIFLINRYLKHPIFKYKIYKVFDDNSICFVIIRIIYLKKNCLIKIVDFIGEDENIMKIGKLLKYLKKKYKPEVIDICSYGINKKYLKSLGLLDRRKFKNLIIPDHTSPLEQKNIDLFIGYISPIKKEKYIRIMRGDGDRDRPS